MKYKQIKYAQFIAQISLVLQIPPSPNFFLTEILVSEVNFE